jgi:diguanylate cyclase (GGDEF)-like protein
MQLDGFTVLLCTSFIGTLLGILFLVFWIKDKRSIWFAWWSATFFLSEVAAALFLAGRLAADFYSIGLGVAALIAAYACSWQGARAFEGRTPIWLPVLGMPVLWLIACLVPGFIENNGNRVVLSSLLLAPTAAMTAVEFFRGRQEPLPSRQLIIFLFASLAAFFTVRIPLAGWLPFPFGALPMQLGALASFNLVLLLHTIALAVLIVALCKERLEREQHLKAQTDLLTGALNRRAFAMYGERLMSRHRTTEKPFCLLLLDIDHFKSLNDRFGHSAGDEILTRFVATVRDNIRPGDFLFRIGGDEFCCLLPETNADQARRVAERVRERFEAARISVAGVPVKMTASIGVASTETFGYILDVLMHRADMAAYAAKREGRNKVIVATVLNVAESNA